MKKFNLFTEIITVSTKELQNELESGEKFGINIDGQIVKEPYNIGEILIYSGVPDNSLAIEKAFGEKYQVVLSDQRVLIKAFSNWQELIAINTPLSSYDDTTADGVAEFSSQILEDLGWQATEFNISYRELVEVLEENADGITLCIEQEEPYQFSGFGFIFNDEQARDILYNYCQKNIKDKLENNDDFKDEYLEDDQIEAKEYFGL